ncbi:MAG TPA: TonB-dependent receptor, partial [candidate division WOR-3 bacterium]|nr:TonB-dependent receptor [candidate division WOR-3 bacterium]
MLILGLLIPLIIGTEDDTLKVYWLDEIVVTATRTPRAVKDLSATVSVVTEDEIDVQNANSAPDLLVNLPGVFVEKTGAFGRSDIDIRGIGDRGRKVMVLVDGRPVKMGLFGCTVTHTLPLNNVERIEVVRGPASVLYGSDALGGVVNILTKKVEDGLSSDLRLAYGSHNTRQGRLRHGAKIGRFEYYLTGDYQDSDGHLKNSAYEGKDITGRLGYQLTDWLNASLSGKYFDGYKEEPLKATDPDTLVSDVWNKYRRGAVDLSLNGNWERITSMTKAYVNFGHHEFSDGWHSKDSTYGFVANLSGRFLPGNELTVGFEYRRQLGEKLATEEQPTAGSWSKYEYGVFLHDEQLLFRRFNLTFGGRVNQDEISGRTFIPQVGLVYPVIDGTIIRGSINRGFRSPQLNELYMFPPSNPDLKAEFVTNYEAGLDQRIISGVYLDLVGYLMKGENMIEIVPNPNPPPRYRFENTGEFEFRGVEFGLKAKIGNYLHGQISYSHLDLGEKTTGRPGDKIDLFLRADFQNFDLGLTGQYVTNYYAADSSQDRIDDYVLINTRFSYSFSFGLRPFIAVDNLLDQDYVVYANLPGGSAGRYMMPMRT